MATFIRFLLLLGLVGLCLPGWAQKKPIPKDSTNTPSVTGSATAYQPNLSDLFSQNAPKTPTAAGLSRYGDYPVSMYTGLPTIEIPLFEFSVGTLKVPIKLTYHASGNKVTDLASWVGLGWSLQTGGQMTRTVLGRPDEQANGLLTQAVPHPSSYYDTGCPTDNGDTQISYRADNVYDTQRDVFAYQTPRGSNSFLLGPASELPNGAVFLKSEPVRVAYDSGLSSLTLTDETGTRFRFSDGEATSAQTGPFGYSGFTSTWYLSEIVSLASSDKAIYTYSGSVSGLPLAPEWIDTQTVYADLFEDPTGAAGVSVGQTPSNIRTNAASPVGTRFLQAIQFPGGKLTFTLEARSGGGYNLKAMDIFGYDVTQSSYALIKRVRFQYATPARSNSSETETLLTGVTLMASDTTTTIGSYSLTYNATQLPSASSLQKDYWGYFNNNTGNTLIPASSYTFSSGSATYILPVGDASRTPDETRMKAWILQSIQYPTGGSTQFGFEANRYSGGTLAGGLRIHQIRSYTATGQLATVKTYKYGPGENGDGTFRSQLLFRPSSVLNIKHNEAGAGASRYSYKAYTYSSNPTYPLVPGEGSPVTYSVVAEYREDGLGNNIGKTVYTFRDDASDQYTYRGAGKGYLTSRSWNRGQLLSETMTDAGGQLRSQTINSYSVTASGSTTSLAGALVVRQIKQTGIRQPDGNGCYITNQSGENFNSDDMYYPLQTYNYSYGAVQQTGSSDYTYADDNSGAYTLKTSQTDYDPVFLLPRETRLLAEGPATSGNAVVGTHYWYPQDFAIPANASSNELKGLRALQVRNAYLPVETVQFRQETTSSGKDYKTGKLTTYHPLTLNGLETALPYQTHLLESVYSTFFGTGYQSSADRYSGSSTTFPIDPRYALRVTVNGYDSNGNLLGYTLTGGASTSFSYGTYTPSGGVLFSAVSAQTQNTGQTNAQTTQYGYSIPLLGPSSMTDPRGIVTAYQYDNFGRLATVKDQNNYVLKSYTYHYATQP